MNNLKHYCYTQEEAGKIVLHCLKYINKECKFSPSESGIVTEVFIKRLSVIINRCFENGFTVCFRFQNGEVRQISDVAVYNRMKYKPGLRRSLILKAGFAGHV